MTKYDNRVWVSLSPQMSMGVNFPHCPPWWFLSLYGNLIIMTCVECGPHQLMFTLAIVCITMPTCPADTETWDVSGRVGAIQTHDYYDYGIMIMF